MRWPRIIFFLTAGKKTDKIGLSGFPAPCKSNVSPGSCGYVHSAETGLYYLQSRYYNPKIGRFLNADALVSTGQGVLGNNMFAYCLNNPVAYNDSQGMIAKICLTADGEIEDSPWRNHSPGGGGIIYHCDNITTQYDGDKFYTQIIARIVWNGIKKGVNWAWDTYSRENNRQVEAQRIEAEMINSIAPRIVNAGVKKGCELAVEQAAYVAVQQISSSNNQDYGANAKTIGIAFVAGFCVGSVYEMYNIYEEALNSP